MARSSTTWQPGQSGNPGGNRKGAVSLWRRIQAVLEWEGPSEEALAAHRRELGAKAQADSYLDLYPCQDGYDRAAVAHARKMIRGQGDTGAAHYVIDRQEGKVSTPIDHGGLGGGLTVVIEEATRKAAPDADQGGDAAGQDDAGPDS